RHRQRELLTEEAINEAPAAHFAAVFQAAEGHGQLAPARQVGLARQQVAEYHTIARQQRAASRFNRMLAFHVLRPIEQRPAAGGVARARSPAGALPGAPL